MIKLRPLTAMIFGAGLLQGCVAPAPVQQQMVIQPFQQVRHSADQTAATYYQVGKYHHERGNLDLALTAYSYAFLRDKGHIEARNAAASIHAQQGRLDQAKALLLQVVAEFPNVAHPYNNLGYVLYMQGDHEGAIATLRMALALDAGNARARNNLKLAEASAASASGRGAIALGMEPPPAAATFAVEPAPQLTVATPAAHSLLPAALTAPEVAADRPMLMVQPKATLPHLAPAVPTALLPVSRMELVQVLPNVFELKERVAPAPVVAVQAAPMPAAAPVASPVAAPVAAPVPMAPVAMVPAAVVPVAVAPVAVAPVPPMPAPEPLPAPAPEPVLVAAAAAPVPQQAPPEPALPVATVAHSVPVAAPLTARNWRIEVSNGNGVEGMARRVSKALGTQGITVARLTNDRPFRQQETRIQYREGYRQQAHDLQKALQGNAIVVASGTLSPRSDVRLVLGKDAAKRIALLDAGTHTLAVND